MDSRSQSVSFLLRISGRLDLVRWRGVVVEGFTDETSHKKALKSKREEKK